MNRIHLALNTPRFDESVRFYSRLFGQPPVKLKPGYAKFDVLDPAVNLTLNEKQSAIGGDAINHLGIELDRDGAVAEIRRRLQQADLEPRIENDVICCYARQDKVWVSDPNGHEWEFFFVREQLDAPGEKTEDGCCA